MLGTWEIILIVLVILLIFGGKKIPELMRGLGKGVRSFKDGVNGVEEDDQEKGKAKAKENLSDSSQPES
ncbi:MAG: twin-arginine translocase TatA/TatE family subunit [Paludibacteraceae bacterium]|nr:twin-arginine translocase TatA/TatE family subunit [Paludibacteraceae bacterium]MBR0065543.1 twin-arginine translocase TatA/TatE family subunit [Paludibacteraceae bacterium]